MGDVVHTAFGSKPGYEESLFRQALRAELDQNEGHLTHDAIRAAFLRTIDIAKVFEAEDPDKLDRYVGTTFALLAREAEFVDLVKESDR